MNPIKHFVRFFLFFLFSFFCGLGYSQLSPEDLTKRLNSDNNEDLLKLFNECIMADDVQQAKVVAEKLWRLDSISPSANYRYGYCLLNSNTDIQLANRCLKRAVANTSLKFDQTNIKDNRVTVDAYYWYAYSFHVLEEIDSAEWYYNKFLESSIKGSYLMFFAKNRLEQCKVAQKLMEYPKDVAINSLKGEVNTIYPEYSGVVSYDGSGLYFTSKRPWNDNEGENNPSVKLYHPEDIYLTVKDENGLWGKVERLPFCSETQNEGVVSLSYDERRIFTYNDLTGNGDIYEMEVDSFVRVVKAPEMIDIKGVNSEFWDTHFTISADSLVVFFASDRPGGMGGKDIYKMTKLGNGSWSLPVNCGPSINSTNDEDSPYISADSKMLYYSSNSTKSMGGFDVFVTVLDDNLNCVSGINLGYPINSGGDDVFFTTTIDGRKGYLSSYRKSSLGGLDLYEIEFDDHNKARVSVMESKVILIDNNVVTSDLKAELKCISCSEQHNVEVEARVRDNKFYLDLLPCEEYELKIVDPKFNNCVYTDKIVTKCNENVDKVGGIYYFRKGEIGKVPALFKWQINVKGNKSSNPITCSINSTAVKVNFRQVSSSVFLSSTTFPDTLFNLIYKEKVSVIRNSISSFHPMSIDSVANNIIYSSIDLNKDLNGNILTDLNSLKPIYFDYRKFSIRKDAGEELDKLVTILKNNPEISLILHGYADSRGDVADNLELARKRSLTCKEYLIKKGISANRLMVKTHGEADPVFSDKVIFNSKDPEKQEYYYQMNRRVEFVVD